MPDLALSSAKSAELSEDRKSLTVEFSDPEADWAEAFRAPEPAHFAAERALGIDSSEAAKDEVVAAVESARDGRAGDLAEIAAAWASTFDPDLGLPPASGPYVLSSVDPGVAEMRVDPAYEGARRPAFERYELRTLADPAAVVQALSIGELDLVQIAWSQSLRDVLGRIGADSSGLPDGPRPDLLIGWFHRDLDHVEPSGADLGALWNPWAWTPYEAVDG